MKEEQIRDNEQNDVDKDSFEYLEIQFKKRFEKMFDGLKDVSSLADALATYDKNQLDVIRRNLNIPGLSSANKPKLIAALDENIKSLLSVVFKRFTETEYKFINNIIKHKGKIEFKEELSDILLYFRSFGIVGCFSNENGEKYVFIPEDLLNNIKALLKDEEINTSIKQNEKVKKLMKGYLYYYGAVESLELYDLVNQYCNEALDVPTATNLFFDIASKDFGICYDNNFWYLDSDLDYEEIIRQQKMRENLKPVELTESQVLEAAEDNFMNWNEHDKKLISFLTNILNVPEENGSEYVYNMKLQFKMGYSSSDAIQDVISVFNIQAVEHAHEVVSLLSEVYNNTNQWFLKGNTPKQVLPAEITVQATSAKIGRNAPCPCGSGKKYKHCCLK